MTTAAPSPGQLFMFGVVENDEIAVLINPDSLDAHVMREGESFRARLDADYPLREAPVGDPYRNAALEALSKYGTGDTVTDYYIQVKATHFS